jgi:4-hydroxy-4-methyl-2-oxoglutarate aldolase
MEINGPIAIAGKRVNPGDLIIADDSGVVVIPAEKVTEVLEKIVAATRKEVEVIKVFESGASLEERNKQTVPPSKW